MVDASVAAQARAGRMNPDTGIGTARWVDLTDFPERPVSRPDTHPPSFASCYRQSALRDFHPSGYAPNSSSTSRIEGMRFMTRPSAPITRLLAAVVALGFALVVRADDEPKKSSRSVEPVIEVKLTDDSIIKLTLLEGQIEFLTPHGKLTIPVNEIRKVDLGMRIPDDVAAAIQSAAADLGNSQFRKREEAMALLFKYREKSYPALKLAAKSPDAEISKRAEELMEKLQNLVPEGRLEMPDYDVIHTEKSKIAGKILTPTLRARSFTFGDVQLKLADALAMSTNGFNDKEELVAALPDPGSLTAYQQPQHIGKTFVFKVTGAATGTVWGTEMYTLDSPLAAAAVHMGVLKVGQTGNVRVTIFGPSVNFIGSTRNGITTSPYANYPGAYRIHGKQG
jgi:LCCL domain